MVVMMSGVRGSCVLSLDCEGYKVVLQRNDIL